MTRISGIKHGKQGHLASVLLFRVTVARVVHCFLLGSGCNQRNIGLVKRVSQCARSRKKPETRETRCSQPTRTVQ